MRFNGNFFNGLWEILLLLASFNALASTAEAYLDPGTGSFVFQILIAFLVGSLFAIKMFWSKLVGLLKRPFVRKTAEKNEDE